MFRLRNLIVHDFCQGVKRVVAYHLCRWTHIENHRARVHVHFLNPPRIVTRYGCQRCGCEHHRTKRVYARRPVRP